MFIRNTMLREHFDKLSVAPSARRSVDSSLDTYLSESLEGFEDKCIW